jgi:hypothetical protein
MQKMYMPLLLTFSKGDWDWVAKLWLSNYEAKSKMGVWGFQDTEFLNPIAYESKGFYRLVGTPGADHQVVFWDQKEDKPAFILHNAPVSPYLRAACKAASGLIVNPRNKVGVSYNLEWVYSSDLNVAV